MVIFRGGGGDRGSMIRAVFAKFRDISTTPSIQHRVARSASSAEKRMILDVIGVMACGNVMQEAVSLSPTADSLVSALAPSVVSTVSGMQSEPRDDVTVNVDEDLCVAHSHTLCTHHCSHALLCISQTTLRVNSIICINQTMHVY